MRKAFTLIELLVVLGILGILAAIVITAVAPSRQITAATDAWRKSASREISNAITQYVIENGDLPSGIPTGSSNALPICAEGMAGETVCVDLDILVTDNFLTALPVDSAEASGALIGFTIYEAPGGFVTIDAEHLGAVGQTSGGSTGTTGGTTGGVTGGATGGGAPEVIEEEAAPANDPVVAAANGRAFVSWQQTDGSHSTWANRYDGGWGTAQAIEGDSGDNGGDSDIAADASGNAIAVWTQSDGSLHSIWANRYAAGVGWGTAAAIESSGEETASDPNIGMDSSGNAIVAWAQSDGSVNTVYAARYVSGVGWSSPVNISSSVAAASNVRVAVNAAGEAVVAYIENSLMYGVNFSPGGGWSSPTALDMTGDGGFGVTDPPSIAVAISASGEAAAAWTQMDGTRVARYDGTWQASDSMGVSGPYGNHALEFDSGDNLHAVFTGYTDNYHLYANRYEAGVGWGVSAQIDTDPYAALYPDMVVDSDDVATLVWQQPSGTTFTYSAWFNTYVPGVGWGTPQLLEEDEAGDATYPHIATDGTNETVVWSQNGNVNAVRR